jgi:hypothetical protein
MIRWTDDAPTEIRAEEGWNPQPGSGEFPQAALVNNATPQIGAA